MHKAGLCITDFVLGTDSPLCQIALWRAIQKRHGKKEFR